MSLPTLRRPARTVPERGAWFRLFLVRCGHGSRSQVHRRRAGRLTAAGLACRVSPKSSRRFGLRLLFTRDRRTSQRRWWFMRVRTCVLFVPVVAALLAAPASAGDFFFSTGDPDGKMATASRPGSAGKIEIESADDFVLTYADEAHQRHVHGPPARRAPRCQTSSTSASRSIASSPMTRTWAAPRARRHSARRRCPRGSTRPPMSSSTTGAPPRAP